MSDKDAFQRERYYGVHAGFVRNNADPERLGRMQIHVPTVYDQVDSQDLPWALYSSPFGGGPNYGYYMVPEIDAQVSVQFIQGDPWHPVWFGTFSGYGDTLTELASKSFSGATNIREMKTPGGHRLTFDDTTGTRETVIVSSTGHEILLDDMGTNLQSKIRLRTLAGHTVTLDDTVASLGIRCQTVAGHSLNMSDVPATLGATLTSSTGHFVWLSDVPATAGILIRTLTGHSVWLSDMPGSAGIAITTALGHLININDTTSTFLIQDVSGNNKIIMNALTGTATFMTPVSITIDSALINLAGIVNFIPA